MFYYKNRSETFELFQRDFCNLLTKHFLKLLYLFLENVFQTFFYCKISLYVIQILTQK